MGFQRSAGILLHVTSLPGRCGVGDLGPAAEEFVDALVEARIGLWQMLPVGPTGYGDSPYQSPSSFAGNPLLISLEKLAEAGWLPTEALKSIPKFDADRAEFDRVRAWREPLLQQAFEKFHAQEGGVEREDFVQFRQSEQWWLEDYALFTALKRAHPDCGWTGWDPALVRRDAAAIAKATSKLKAEIERECFLQFHFARQWRHLKAYAYARHVRLIGDVPIFAAHDSADVWSHQDLFELKPDGRPQSVAGVPPDYFSETGQLWGNPLYRWDVHAKQGYSWWIQRLRRAFEMFDLVRIDHFRGFESYWEVPGDAADARGGSWMPGPGTQLFHAAEAALGRLPVIAEDLGLITPPVEALRDELGYPGMRVLQFAFGDDPKGVDYRPHAYPRHCVVYTGTHDNDTTVGWFHSEAGEGTTRTEEQVERERNLVMDYLGSDGREIHWDMIRAAYGSVADTAVVPLQDILGLGSEARMNMPGTAAGNWQWRYRREDLTPEIVARLRRMSTLYERLPIPEPIPTPPEVTEALAAS